MAARCGGSWQPPFRRGGAHLVVRRELQGKIQHRLLDLIESIGRRESYLALLVEYPQALAAVATARLDVHLKIDTGMHRVGAPPDSLTDLLEAVVDPLRLAGVWTHFPVADEDPEYTRHQIERLLQQDADDRAWAEQIGPVYRQGDVATAELEADLRQLGRLARAGLAGDDHDLVVADECPDLLAPLADRQLGRVVQLVRGGQCGPPRLDLRGTPGVAAPALFPTRGMPPASGLAGWSGLT